MSQNPSPLARRTFLQAGAALGFAAVAGRADEDKKAKTDDKKAKTDDKPADPAADPYGGFTLGIQSYTFRNFDLEPCLKRTQECGLHYIELFQKHCPANGTPDQIKAVRRLCADYGVTPLAFGVQGFGKDHGANKKMFEFGKALGIRTFSADPTPDSFDSLDKLCEEYKIAIAIHPHGPVGGGKLHRWYSAEVIMEAVKDHHPLIGSCLDTAHLLRVEQVAKKLEVPDQVKVMGARNFGMHLKDHDNAKKTDVVYGKGGLNVAAVLKEYRKFKAWAYISIEYEANAEEPTADVKACVDVFKETVAKLA